MTTRERVRLLVKRLELRALFLDEFLAMLVEFRPRDETDGLQVLFDDVAKFRDDGRHELAARLPVAATRVEHSLQFVHQEGNVATLAEHRRDDAR